MGKDFNEDSRVKIPALLTFTRLGYGYLSLKGRAAIDPQTNIFKDIFFEALKRINPETQDGDFKRHFGKIQTCLDNDDLGKEFFTHLTAKSGIKLIDFTDFKKNTLTVVTELPYGSKDDENFRPDITLLINGMPLAFIEVKKPNNREGILAEHDRITLRFKNRKFRRFANIAQIVLFSNNMEYEDGDIEPIQGAFYAASAKEKVFFNRFREEKDHRASLLGFVKDENDAIENFILKDTNYAVLKYNKEFATNKNLDSPTNRAILSLFAPERFSELLQYGIAYVNRTDKEGREMREKHIMRYPQYFASKAIQEKLDSGVRKGIIWHTQGSGKTALAYFNVKWLTDYFQKKNILPKFYFIVDRIDLRNQASSEFESRGLKVVNINSRDDFIKDLKKTAVLSGLTGEREITVINIHKFSEDSRATKAGDYNVHTQRIYFIDEAHRSYNPKGSFLANLVQSDTNAIIISLTGTPLLGKGEVRIASTKLFGEYIHKYYYDQSIRDGYTVRLIREEIESTYKLNLKEIFENLKIREGDARIQTVYAHENFCTPLLEYIVADLRKSRMGKGDDTIGGMVVCQSSEQAKMLFSLFQRTYENKAKDSHTPKRSILILHDEDDTTIRKRHIEDFKEGKIDLIFVFNMLLTGFDSPRLKKLYLGRVIKEHNLLQCLTRVNRPYPGFKFGYVVDFANIKDEFDKTNRAYWNELQGDWGDDFKGYTQMFLSPDEIINNLDEIKEKTWKFNTENAEVFQQEISEIRDKKELLDIQKALTMASDMYNLIRLNGYDELIAKLDFKKLKIMLGEVQHRIALINRRQQSLDEDKITALLHEALEETLFMFRKIGEGPLDLAANTFQDAFRKTRVAMTENIDPKDPEWVRLKDELDRLLKERNWDEAGEKELQEGSKILDEIYKRVQKLNSEDTRLADKYKNDGKYVRIHKAIIRGQKLNTKERSIFEALADIKEDTDEQLLLQNMIENVNYFEQFIQKKVIDNFLVKKEIEIDPETAKFIKNLIVKEYMNEREAA